MADIVGIFAASHTPVMSNLPDAPEASVASAVYAALRTMGEQIRELRPDALLLISDDHLHNFFLDNLPAFCIGAADEFDSPIEGWLKVERRMLPGNRSLAAHLLDHCLASGFDPAFSLSLRLDHGMATPLDLMGLAGDIPIVPLLVNTVQPPMPRMERCIAIGQAIGAAVRSYSGCDRVVVLATGGLSHDVGTPRMGMVNEQFDREVLTHLIAGDPTRLAQFCTANVASAGNGAEEIRNWLVAHGIAECRGFEELFYAPVAEWYTGIALGQWCGDLPA